ncbi:MAG TPA: helix-hairpin-helix domain-containing protein [Longimicrobium sp.]|nr:helix-hairpin-helix domain-containing protein [Longimicrobium sp.]
MAKNDESAANNGGSTADSPQGAAAEGRPPARRNPTPRAPRAAKEAGGAAREGATTSTRVARAAGPRAGASRQSPVRAEADLRAELRDFASGRPTGWDHDDWMSFLDHLRGKGHDVGNSDDIGMALERERLAVRLGKVAGMGPRRVDSLVERFDTLYSLAGASVDEIAAVPGMNRSLAERVRQQIG